MVKLSDKLQKVKQRHEHDLGAVFRAIFESGALTSGKIQFDLPDNYTLDSVPADGDTVAVPVRVKDLDGEEVKLFDGDLTLSTTDSAADTGTTSIESPVTLQDGYVIATLTFSNNWQTGDSVDVTVDSQSVCGYTISSATVTISM